MWPSYRKAEMIQPLHIFRNVIEWKKGEIDNIKEDAKNGSVIFNPNKKRLQKSIYEKNLLRKLKSALNKINVSNDRQMTDVVTLYSKPGCLPQRYHRDYDHHLLFGLKTKPRGVIFALEDFTYFKTPNKIYTLYSGDILVFDGDLIHAGAGYDKENVRIHAYLDVDDIYREKNRVWFV